MTDRSKLLVKGFIALTESEQAEILKTLREYSTGSTIQKNTIQESVASVTTGPLGSGRCPLCGK